MRIMRQKTLKRELLAANNKGRNETAAEIRNFLSHADKVYLEPVTGYVGSVTNSLFLIADGGTALTILPEPEPESDGEG